MRRLVRTTATALVALTLGATAAHAQYTVYGVRNIAGAGQQLVSFNSTTPAAVTTIGATGASLTGIDFRPANGTLYGYDGTSVYTLNTTTGAAMSLFTPTTATTGNGGFDFNPAADRLRVISPGGTNLRLNVNAPFTAANTITDGGYSYASGAIPSFTAVAYTNSVAGAASTQLYGVDQQTNSLVLITTPNGGAGSVADPVGGAGNLGLAAGSVVTGFDIVTVGSSNFGFLSVTAAAAAISSFYSVNLATGATTLIGSIGTGGTIADIAIVPSAVPEPGTWALMATGLVGLGAAARRRRNNA